MKTANNNFKKFAFTIGFIVILNLVGHFLYKRFDLTADKRYTLSQTSLNIVAEVKEPLYIDVYLEGDFPGEFKKLQTETQQLLEEFREQNSNIIFRFINPLSDNESDDITKKALIYSLHKLNNTVTGATEEKEIKESIDKIEDLNEAVKNSFIGNSIIPVNVTLSNKGKQTQEMVFPWSIASSGNRSVKIPLLKNMMGASTAEKVVSSVQHLEYAFANAINSVTHKRQKKVIIIQGNGELKDRYIADFIKSVKENYFIAPFPLDSINLNPIAGLKYLKKYDLAIIAKPTQSFSDEQKQVLDQFIINGGKTVWLVDQVNMELDSLYNQSGTNLAFPRDLNLNDMFFKYGIRMNPDLIKDLMATPIVLETGEPGSATQKVQLPWYFSPMIYPAQETKHPIVTNLDAIKFQFASPIEILKNNIKKTVLLQSSQYSKLVGTPAEISLRMASEELGPKDFVSTGNYPVAVLLEGQFHSVYENRLLSFKDNTYKKSGKDNKMIVISDGDVIKNQLDKNGREVELGLDQGNGIFYANKEFMMNCVNYLLDDNGLINIRSKDLDLPLLDKEKVYERYTSIQFLTIGLPILILLVFGVLFTFFRKRKYNH
jgi:gliding-associated putative ABC transporter substrate-binding component GldG